MWIDYIKLKNFRQYQNQKIIFSGGVNKKSFNIIRGTNDSGKTNFLNAITWCLYGNEYHLGIRNQIYPIVNTITMDEAKPGEIIDVEVEIQFKDEDDRIIVNRKIRFKKNSEGEVIKLQSSYGNEPDGSEIKILRKINRKGLIEVDKIVIETTVPEILREYFFFDGEHLDDYFKENSPLSIKDAVFKISQLEKIADVIEHIEVMKSELIRKQKYYTPDVQEKQDLLEVHQQSLTNYKNELKGIENDFKEAKKEEIKYREHLSNVNVENIKNLEIERETLGEEAKRIEDQIVSLKNEKNDYLIEKAPSILMYEPIDKTLKLLREKKEAGEIPPDFKKNYIGGLLDNGECICGTDISKENPELRKKVENIFSECGEISNIAIELGEMNIYLKRRETDIDDFQKKLKRFNDELNGLEKESKKKNNRIKEIGLKIEGIDIEKIRRWEKKRKRYEDIRDEKKEEIGKHKSNILQEGKEIKRIEDQLEEELKKEEKSSELLKKIDFYKNSHSAAQKIYENIMESMRKEIEKKTEEQFLQLIWKDKNYTKVIIDQDYNVYLSK